MTKKKSWVNTWTFTIVGLCIYTRVNTSGCCTCAVCSQQLIRCRCLKCASYFKAFFFQRQEWLTLHITSSLTCHRSRGLRAMQRNHWLRTLGPHPKPRTSIVLIIFRLATWCVVCSLRCSPEYNTVYWLVTGNYQIKQCTGGFQHTVFHEIYLQVHISTIDGFEFPKLPCKMLYICQVMLLATYNCLFQCFQLIAPGCQVRSWAWVTVCVGSLMVLWF